MPLVREDNGEALRVILEKQDNVTAEFIYRTEKKVRSGWLKLEIEQDGCRRSDNRPGQIRADGRLRRDFPGTEQQLQGGAVCIAAFAGCRFLRNGE